MVDFRIEKQIGASGMGIVYLATQVSLNRQVALKVLVQSLTRQSDIGRETQSSQHRQWAKPKVSDMAALVFFSCWGHLVQRKSILIKPRPYFDIRPTGRGRGCGSRWLRRDASR